MLSALLHFNIRTSFKQKNCYRSQIKRRDGYSMIEDESYATNPYLRFRSRFRNIGENKIKRSIAQSVIVISIPE